MTADQKSVATPLVGILMGSKTDLEIALAAGSVFDELGIPHEKRVLSAHRTPEQAVEYARTAADRGLKAIIGIAGMAAHLSGVLASHTLLPVIGVPAGGGLMDGLDALLSTVQMPPGIPVATVAVGRSGGKNAAWLAARIIAVSNADVRASLEHACSAMREQVLQTDQEVREMRRS